MFDDERAGVPKAGRVTTRQSLTVVFVVTDVAACGAALARHRAAVEAAFVQMTDLDHACLALLPPLPGAADGALFLESSFGGALAELLGALFRLAEAEIGDIFASCAAFPDAADARTFTAYVSARARRAHAAANGGKPNGWRRAHSALAARCYWPSSPAQPDAAELEQRRGAVGMQDWQPGAPLLHVARMPTEAHRRARLKRALRALDQDALPLEASARFLMHGDRLLFVAYPAQIALLWSERVSRVALAPLTRIWSAVPAFQGQPWLRRARRARQLQRFLLDGRTPVGVWFNAAEPRSGQ